MDVADHWHAYEWVGQELPGDDVRMDPAQPFPPVVVSHWLRKPGTFVVATFENPVGVAAARRWMREGGEAHPSLAEGSFPLAERLRHVDDLLARGADVVWGYYSATSRYVSRALIACPRDGRRCPYGY